MYGIGPNWKFDICTVSYFFETYNNYKKYILSNLLFEINEARLRDVFSLAGNIQRIEMQKSGHAVISYSKVR